MKYALLEPIQNRSINKREANNKHVSFLKYVELFSAHILNHIKRLQPPQRN